MIGDLTPAEQAAVFVGANRQRDERYELALFTAWHTAAFNGLAKAGKLQAWSTYRRKSATESDQPVVTDWKARKAERTAQMERRKKHQQQKQRPVRKRHG